MNPTDIRITEAQAQFHEVVLDQPFAISGRPITHFTVAKVTLTAQDRGGTRAQGVGYSMLSVPWAWPQAEVDVPSRDQALRTLVRQFTDSLPGGGWGAAIQLRS